MTRTLKEWAELFDNCEYGNEPIDDYIREMKEDGVVAVYGQSDDLMEMSGAYENEYACYGKKSQFTHFDGRFVTEDMIDEFLAMVKDEYTELYKSVSKYITEKTESNFYVKAYTTIPDCQFHYETNIPCEWFTILDEDGKLYCKGFVFDIKSLSENR